MNLLLLLQMAAEGFGDRVAIGSRDDGLSYAGLLQKAKDAAHHVQQSASENIAFAGVNSPVFPIALFGAAAAGKPFAPLNYRLPNADLAKLVDRLLPCSLFADDDIFQRLGTIAGAQGVSRENALSFAHAEEKGLGDLSEEAIAVLLFTSGTTGDPKAAILRHNHLTSYVLQTVEFMSADEDEAILISVPPYHIAGVSSILTSIYSGRRIVQLPAFQPADWVSLAAREGVTHAMLVPTMLGRVLDILEASGERLPALRHLSYGGGRMPSMLITRAMTLLPHVNFVNAYGLTETSSTVAILDAEEHRRAFASSDHAVRRRLGSVGRPLPSLELEVRGPNGQVQPPDIAGEIWVRGEQVSGEYIGKKVIRDDGWMPTNDSGWLDADGFLFVDGRLDDVIVRGGENISPGEIEDVLRSHAAVRDVAVIGLPDEEWGERVAAVLVLHEPAASEELQAWVRARLRSTKVPQEIHLRDELPYNDLGKLLRRNLKQQLAPQLSA